MKSTNKAEGAVGNIKTHMDKRGLRTAHVSAHGLDVLGSAWLLKNPGLAALGGAVRRYGRAVQAGVGILL